MEEFAKGELLHTPAESLSPRIELLSKLDEAHVMLTKQYLQVLEQSSIVPYHQEYPKERERGMRWYKISHIVYEEGVHFVDQFSMLLSALHGEAREVVMLLHKSKHKPIELYLGASDNDPNNRSYAAEILEASLNGIFPGIRYQTQSPDDLLDFSGKAVSCVSAVGSLRDEHKDRFVQGLERLINATSSIPTFTAMLIAERISEGERLALQQGYADMYSMLSPMASVQTTRGREESQSLSKGESEAISRTLTEGITRTITHGTTSNETLTESLSNSTTKGRTRNLGVAISSSLASTGGVLGATIGSAVVPGAGTATGALVGAALGAVAGVAGSLIGSSNKSTTESRSESSSIAQGTSRSESDGTSESKSRGTTSTTNTSSTDTQGRSQSITLTQENKAVSVLLEQIEDKIKRLDAQGSLGMWNCASYIISPTTTESKQLANIYRGCVLGEGSNFELSTINTWGREREAEVAQLAPYLHHYVHPRFEVYREHNVSAGALVSSSELAVHMALPQSSVPGVLVREETTFGREVRRCGGDSSTIYLGEIQHLGKVQVRSRVDISVEDLTMHTFVTGSTGSGKSTVVYQILNELLNRGVKCLVVEPAKGEYKDILGTREGVKVYGTNPRQAELLRLNPFSFPSEIHVSEHIDGLVEIFNACWPMYAAMPAVLKAAIEEAYRSVGWDMESSESRFGLFPGFVDVLRALQRVIASSQYSEELKSNYRGALETRISDLTRGITGQLFSGQELSNEALFDNSVVVDLSRVQSMETKALLMGLITLKLSEHRRSEGKGRNRALHHITVLEEAHNLLKRTSTSQSSEGSNLIGKSVEMIANSIAEMRTYGEGFIIVDQSPSAVDSSAIRNTNTKIALSLPDKDDRESVGRAMGLKDEQIEELSRLSRGEAVVYQNSWEEAVLCRVHYDEHLNRVGNYIYIPQAKQAQEDLRPELLNILFGGKIDFPKDDLEELIRSSDILSATDKVYYLSRLQIQKDGTAQNFSGSILQNAKYVQSLFDLDALYQELDELQLSRGLLRDQEEEAIQIYLHRYASDVLGHHAEVLELDLVQHLYRLYAEERGDGVKAMYNNWVNKQL